VVLCDAEAIQQVCVDLLVNALEVLPTGGRLEIELGPSQDGRASFFVRDDGPGVPPSLRERIFDPFVTGREDGVGLGLTSAKRVVHEHGGEIQLEPSIAGACFRIELPLAGDRP
jgi:two-component system sensor histidine kinase HupT/HoxJ